MCIFRNSFILHLNVEIDQSETAFLLNISADTQKLGSRRLAIRIWDSNTRWALKWDKYTKGKFGSPVLLKFLSLSTLRKPYTKTM